VRFAALFKNAAKFASDDEDMSILSKRKNYKLMLSYIEDATTSISFIKIKLLETSFKNNIKQIYEMKSHFQKYTQWWCEEMKAEGGYFPKWEKSLKECFFSSKIGENLRDTFYRKRRNFEG
jgi:hypothetical protein